MKFPGTPAFFLCFLATALLAPSCFAIAYDANKDRISSPITDYSKIDWQPLRSPEHFKGNMKQQALKNIGFLTALPTSEASGEDRLNKLVEAHKEWGCTAFFFESAGKKDAPAYMITSGHCVSPSGEYLNPQEVLTDSKPNEDLWVVLNYFPDKPENAAIYPVRRVAVAAYDFMDTAVLELDATYEQLIKSGFVPLTLAKAAPKKADAVELAGFPIDVPEDKQFLHVSSCKFQKESQEVEQTRTITGTKPSTVLHYTWHSSVAHLCSAVPGNSGSPLVSVTNGQVVGTMNAGQSIEKGDYNWAQPVAWVFACLDGNGKWDNSQKGCLDSFKQKGARK